MSNLLKYRKLGFFIYLPFSSPICKSKNTTGFSGLLKTTSLGLIPLGKVISDTLHVQLASNKSCSKRKRQTADHGLLIYQNIDISNNIEYDIV